MIVEPEPVKRMWTEAELGALPDAGFSHEVVNGELVMSPKNNFEHGDIGVRLLTALNAYVTGHRLGIVLDSSTGFWMRSQNCRAPDIAFVTRERLQQLGWRRSPRTFFPGAPDLAVEILAPSNTRTEMDERLGDFFASGTQIAWLVDPATASAEVCHALTRRWTIGPAGHLEGEHLLPGFRYAIADLFKPWDWA
jgi:Uma2 family endonuclease